VTEAVGLTPALIARATGGRVVSGDPDRSIDGFAIDSRTLAAGDLFFAIVAARDGHQFVADAVARGAAGAVVSEAVEIEAGVSGPVVIRVADTTRALQDLAREVRRRSKATVVAITGSAGKTTTKEAMATLLAARYRVVRNRGNLNNHLGLPLSLLELRHGSADMAVMELGMNHAGEIRVLVGVAEPEVRVWTNVGEAHLGHFVSPDALADAKAEILEQAGASDLLVCNADDDLVMARVSRFPGRIVTFGESARADVRASDVQDRGLAGTNAVVSTAAGTLTLHVPLLGRANLANALCATAVAIELGVSMDEIAARVPALKPAPRRGEVIRLASGVTVIDDSYNSSPGALAHALRVIGREPASRRAAVLGEMLELGDHAIRLHEEAGRRAAAASLDYLVTVGGAPAAAMAASAMAAGMRADRIAHVATNADAADRIVSWLGRGDVVLVKGSRGIRTDVVVDRIVAECA
jgi:UDP-N-acetylmuramoyl-tripeptide--D-alanyl-D-alanine ligase